MDLNNLFAQIGSNYLYRCPNIACETVPADRTSAAASTAAPAAPTDEYTPSAGAAGPITYSFQRQARLDYALNLSFDLGTVTRLAESYANGQAVDLEQLSQAGFGLSADLTFSGYQRIKASGDDLAAELGNQSLKDKSSSAAATRGAYQSREVEAAWFSQESSSVRRSLKSQYRNGHLRASNKLEMRFRLDSGFRLNQIGRFNDQTGRLADDQEQALPGYFDSVGALADQAGGGSLNAFFDAVDAYLDGIEDQLVERAETFFGTATDELGFSGELVSIAQDQLTGSIENFFTRVDAALDQLQSPSATDSSLSTVALPGTGKALAELYNPVVDQLKSLLANA